MHFFVQLYNFFFLPPTMHFGSHLCTDPSPVDPFFNPKSGNLCLHLLQISHHWQSCGFHHWWRRKAWKRACWRIQWNWHHKIRRAHRSSCKGLFRQGFLRWGNFRLLLSYGAKENYMRRFQNKEGRFLIQAQLLQKESKRFLWLCSANNHRRQWYL